MVEAVAVSVTVSGWAAESAWSVKVATPEEFVASVAFVKVRSVVDEASDTL